MLFRLRPGLEDLGFEGKGQLPARRASELKFGTQSLTPNLQTRQIGKSLPTAYENRDTPSLHNLVAQWPF